jgi:hypothetical protein
MVVPLRVWLDGSNGLSADFHLVHTLDITPEGARLGGLRTLLTPGQVITLQRGRQKMQFCIKWTRQLGRNEMQAGVESLEPERNIWGIETAEERKVPDIYQEVLLKILTEDE